MAGVTRPTFGNPNIQPFNRYNASFGDPTNNTVFGVNGAPPPQRRNPTGNAFGDPSTYSAAVNTQGSDYDTIMNMYKNIATSNQNNPLSYTPISPTTTPYTQSSDVTKSLSDLSTLADTGGYSASDIANIRERDISPIRSIYANAEQEMERQRSLSGGYSPNFGAIMAQMSRDSANKIGDVTTKANADIAQNVATNKIASSGNYAQASENASAQQTAANQHNSDIINQINELNAQMKMQADEYNRNSTLDTADRMRSLYGTTPALVNTFGNQVTQANQLSQGQQAINSNNRNRIFTLAGA